jgi:hypothetical protein
VSDYGLDGRGSIPHRQRIFPLTSASRPALGPTQPPVQWVPGSLCPGVKRGRGVMLTTHPLLVPRLRKSRSYTSWHPNAPLWSVTGPLLLFLSGPQFHSHQIPSAFPASGSKYERKATVVSCSVSSILLYAVDLGDGINICYVCNVLVVVLSRLTAAARLAYVIGSFRQESQSETRPTSPNFFFVSNT